MTRVEVFIATGCSLCPAAVVVATSVCTDVAVELVLSNIDGDVELERRYRTRIPVVEVNGVEVGCYVITGGELQAAIARG